MGASSLRDRGNLFAIGDDGYGVMGQGVTLRQLFPGNLGELRLATLVLKSGLRELIDFPRDTPLPHALEQAIRGALEEPKG